MESSGGTSPACLPSSHVPYHCAYPGGGRVDLPILSPPLGRAIRPVIAAGGLGEGGTDSRAALRPPPPKKPLDQTCPTSLSVAIAHWLPGGTRVRSEVTRKTLAPETPSGYLGLEHPEPWSQVTPIRGVVEAWHRRFSSLPQSPRAHAVRCRSLIQLWAGKYEPILGRKVGSRVVIPRSLALAHSSPRWSPPPRSSWIARTWSTAPKPSRRATSTGQRASAARAACCGCARGAGGGGHWEPEVPRLTPNSSLGAAQGYAFHLPHRPAGAPTRGHVGRLGREQRLHAHCCCSGQSAAPNLAHAHRSQGGGRGY